MKLVAFCCAFFWGATLRAEEHPEESAFKDLLGPLVVEATQSDARQRHLMRVAIEPSLDAAQADVLLHSVVRRDFELSGEFAEQAPAGLAVNSKSDSPPDMKAWKRAGVEAVVRLDGRDAGAEVALTAELYLMSAPDRVSFRQRLVVRREHARLAAHHLADSLIGGLTGRRGGFESRLTFVQSTALGPNERRLANAEGSRQVFAIDADGHALRLAATAELVSASAFGPDEALFFAASLERRRYRLYRAGVAQPVEFVPNGSVYGVAWNDERTQLALAVAIDTSVRIFTGTTSSRQLKLASSTDMALHPAFSPTGKLAYVGIGRASSRIYVGGRPVSPAGLWASAPVFCNHPDGTRLIYSAGVGKRTDLVMSDERGGLRRRLTQGPGSNGYAACSPDGRLVAFFSTRTSHQGPGLYVMPLAGGTPRRISSTLGDSLRWSRSLSMANRQ